MFIATKYEEIYPPSASDFSYLSDELFNERDLIDFEFNILLSLDFNFSFHSAYRFLERLIKLS